MRLLETGKGPSVADVWDPKHDKVQDIWHSRVSRESVFDPGLGQDQQLERLRRVMEKVIIRRTYGSSIDNEVLRAQIPPCHPRVEYLDFTAEEFVIIQPLNKTYLQGAICVQGDEIRVEEAKHRTLSLL